MRHILGHSFLWMLGKVAVWCPKCEHLSHNGDKTQIYHMIVFGRVNSKYKLCLYSLIVKEFIILQLRWTAKMFYWLDSSVRLLIQSWLKGYSGFKTFVVPINVFTFSCSTILPENTKMFLSRNLLCLKDIHVTSSSFCLFLPTLFQILYQGIKYIQPKIFFLAVVNLHI